MKRVVEVGVDVDVTVRVLASELEPPMTLDDAWHALTDAGHDPALMTRTEHEIVVFTTKEH